MEKVICINDNEWGNENKCPKKGDELTIRDSFIDDEDDPVYEFMEYPEGCIFSQRYFKPKNIINTSEQIKKQIAQDGLKKYPLNDIGHDPFVYWREVWSSGAEAYATRAIAAEAENERLRKALEEILEQKPSKGIEGCTWGDTDYDSMSVAVGYNTALSAVKEIANKALTHKTSTDERRL